MAIKKALYGRQPGCFCLDFPSVLSATRSREGPWQALEEAKEAQTTKAQPGDT